MKRRVSRRQIKALTALVIGVAILVGQHFGWMKPASQILQQTQPVQFRVVSFDDGDTIEVDMNGTKVDTPETHDPRKAVQCFGQAATAFTEQLIASSSVRLEADPLSSNRDRYGRLLRYVYLPDGTLVNLKLISQGYGFAYTGFPFTKSDDFVGAQTEAREQGRGLWHNCQPTTNQYGGYTSNNAN